MKAQSVVEVELKSGNIKRISTEKRVDVFKEQCGKLYEDLNLPNLPHEQRTKRTDTVDTSIIKGGLWEVWDDTENKKLHKIKQLNLSKSLDIGDKRVFEIQRIEYDTCGFCGHPLIAEDYSKGVRVCEGCGSVEGTFVFEKPDEPTEPDKKLGSAEIEFEDGIEYNKALKESVTRLNNTPESQYGDKGAWRKQQYINVLDIISSQLHMNQTQRDTVEYVILKYPLKMFHKRADHHTIIAGLCRYILCRNGHSGSIRFNISVFSQNGLNKTNYIVIEKNIKMFKVFGH